MDAKTIATANRLQIMYDKFESLERGEFRPTAEQFAEMYVDMEDAIKAVETQISLHPEYFDDIKIPLMNFPFKNVQ